MQQNSSAALIQWPGAFEDSADVSFNVTRIEATHFVESQLAKHPGSMAQLSVRHDAGRVIKGVLPLRSNRGRTKCFRTLQAR